MTASSSQWHSVNPHTRPLSLSIIELTPLALTLSLTLASPPSPSLHPTPAHSSHSHQHQHVAHTHNHTHGPPKHRKKQRHRRHESDDDSTAVELDDDGHHMISSSMGSFANPNFLDMSNFKDLLSHGVVVSVNGQPWNRIVAHVSEPEDDGAEGDAEENGEEEADWEDDTERDGEADAEDGPGGAGVTRRRPRKARFTLSAGRAASQHEGDESTLRRRRLSHGTERKGKIKLDRDQAVVVVYGLTPGTEYEIELQVLGLAGPEGDVLASNSVLLPGSPAPSGSLHHPRSRANSFLARSQPASRSNSISGGHPGRPLPLSSQDLSSLPTDPNSSPVNGHADLPAAPIPTNILNPVDTQAAQIRHMIAAAHAEKDHLQTQIKEARRASQRAEAALRSEIETVKRAIDKAGSLDLRAKQKALALQEQVKQGWAGAEHAEQQTESVEKGMDELRSRYDEAQAEVDAAKAEWKTTKGAEDDVREKDKKARVEQEKKLAEVIGKIDKLKTKKEKKEAERSELEAKLEELEKQKEFEERRTVEEKVARRSSAYWWDPYLSHHGHGHGHGPGHSHGHGHHEHHGHRGRGIRHSGPVRPPPAIPPAQPSPTTNNSFYASQVAPPNAASASPAFRPPALSGSPATTNRTPSASGVNVSATPFQPASQTSPTHDTSQHTTLMPPQLQHRIYIPSERPRPSPTFNPPPSVMAEQQRSSPTIASPPSSAARHSPALPETSSPGGHSSGPSLASIVTRAVLSPTSAVLSNQTQGRHSPTPGTPGGGGPGMMSRPSPPPSSSTSSGAPTRHTSATYPSSQGYPHGPSSGFRTNSNPSSPVPPNTSGGNSGHSSGHSSRQTTFGPPPSHDRDRDRHVSSPTVGGLGSSGGIWGSPGGYVGTPRTGTPPSAARSKSRQGRESPLSPGSAGSGGGGASR